MNVEEPVLRYNPEKAIMHPLGVKPGGNIWLAQDVAVMRAARRASLGLFCAISEELLLEVMSFSDSDDLISLSAVSHHCRAFSFHPDLWRDLFWSSSRGNRNFKTSWRDSHLGVSCLDPTPVRNVFSDVLFGPYRASGLTPTSAWIARENIDRVSFKDMSIERFIEEYEKRNKPVIITDYIEAEWKAASSQWSSVDAFAARSLDDPAVDCGPVRMRLSEFKQYVNSNLARLDEAPFFVFDTTFFSSSQAYQNDYCAIPFFSNDLFDLLDSKPDSRPDHKWILIGGPGASSKWHVDPNSTNAWNAVIRGEKKWILIPPHSGPPPGVQVSADGFAVRQPLTLTDWLDTGCYNDLFRMHASNGMVEATCRAGEIMFVPRGWWHCVRNTGESVTIAVTHNYAAESSVNEVRRFLKEKPHCVSGVPVHVRASLWSEFDEVLRLHRPHLVASSESIEKAKEEDQEVSFWDRLSHKTLSFHR